MNKKKLNEKDIQDFLTYHLEFEKLLSQLSYRFIGTTVEKTDDLIIESLGQICGFIGAEKASVYMLDAKNRTILNTHEWRKDEDVQPDPQEGPLQVAKFKYTSGLLKKDKIVIINSQADVPNKAEGEREWFDKYGFRPILFVPVQSEKVLVGTLGFYGNEGTITNWQEEKAELLRVFGDIIWTAISRKEAEKAIRESEQQYRRVFDNIVDVFYEASLDGILLNVSPSVESNFKYKREEIIGTPMPNFYADLNQREDLLKILNKKGYVKGYELLIKDKYGTIKEGILSSRIIKNEKGKPERIVGSILDISELKKAEKQIKQLSIALEQSPLIVIFTDIEGIVEYVNKMFYKTSGLEEDMVIGKNITEISPGTVSADRMKEILSSAAEGKSWQGELEYIHQDDTKLWYQLSVSTIQGDSGIPSHVIYIIQNITPRKEYEENLELAKQKAEQSDQLKSSFLANMSHEIRTPMNAILGFASLLKEDTLPPEQANYYIDIINTKGRDLLRIISDIIDISRIEVGDLLIKLEPIEVYEFIQEIYSEYKEDSALSAKPDLRFRINIPKKKKKTILNTDPARLKQVIVNLIQNALKFTTEGFIEIGFTFNEKNRIKFYVRDTGIGIPAEKQKIIFDRFRQVDDTHTREYGGTGLGLTISRNLVEKLGGKLEVDSEENKGSTFFFELKYIDTETSKDLEDELVEEIEEVEEVEYVSEQPEQTLDLKNKRILVAEDDGTSFIFLETILKKFNAKMVWVKDGNQVLDQLKKDNRFDLILMDIRMPGMDGIEATKKIRGTNNPVPIIAQTAYAQSSDKKMALDSGCNDYISKPIKVPELASVLEKYLG